MTDEERQEREFNQNLERFKIALATRNFEIELFWKRSSYFLALNTALATALAAGLFALPSVQDDMPFLFMFFGICVVGFFVCFAWMKVALGSKYWSSHWEQVVIKEQKYIGFCPKEHRDYFSIEGTDKRVERNLFPRGKKVGCLDACYNMQVLGKPSVSRWMHRTAIVFLAAWVIGGISLALWKLFG